MTEFDSYDHFVKKAYEWLHLWFKHYLPLGKTPPEPYRDFFYELFKIWESGRLPELSKEPMIDKTVEQLGLFKSLPKSQSTLNGTLFEEDKSKK